VKHQKYDSTESYLHPGQTSGLIKNIKQGSPPLHIGNGVTEQAQLEGRQQVPSRLPPDSNSSGTGK
jgi:hypothetical protein